MEQLPCITGRAPAGSLYNPFVWGAPRSVVERFLLRVAMTGGKHAECHTHIDEFLDELCQGREPIARLREIREIAGHMHLLEMLKRHRIGKYTLMSRMLRDVAEGGDVLSRSRDSLCSISGFAMKNASLFKMYSDPDAGVVVLDKTALKWLDSQAPETDDDYRRLEQIFLEKALARATHPALIGFQLWYTTRSVVIRRECHMSILAARRFLAKQKQQQWTNKKQRR